MGASPKPLNRALAQLVAEGVLLQRNVGRMYLFRINRESPLVRRLLVPLYHQEARLLQDALSEALNGVPGLLFASVYGSTAHQREDPHSDVDILVVVEDKSAAESALEERALAFVKSYGNMLSYTVLDLKEFRARYLCHDEFLREAVDKGRLVVGRSALELTYGAA